MTARQRVREGQTFLTAAEVREYINSIGFSARSINTNSSAKSQLNWLLNNLEALEKHYEDRAKDAFKLFRSDINTIDDLQRALNLINESGLGQLSSSIVRKYFKNIPNTTPTSQQLHTALKEYIERDLEEKSKTNPDLREAIINNVLTDELIMEYILKPQLKEFTDIRKSRGMRQQPHKMFNENLLNILFPKDNSDIKTKTLDRDISLFLKSKGINVLEVDSEIPKVTIENNDNYNYPYYIQSGLSESEIQTIKNSLKVDNDRWSKFKDTVASIVTPLDPTTVKTSMDEMGVDYFFIFDRNGLVGKMGELAGYIFMKSIFADGAGSVVASGMAENLKRNKHELGADVLLNETLGVQIKNYKNKSGFFHLKKDLKWNELMGRTQGSGLSSLGQYFATLCFNQPDVQGFDPLYADPEAFETYQGLYEVMRAKRNSMNRIVNMFLAANFGAFFTIDEEFELEQELLPGMGTSGSYDNVFWLLGGNKIVKTSQIIGSIRKRIEQLLKHMESGRVEKAKNEVKLMSNRIKYEGDERWQYSRYWNTTSGGYDYNAETPSISTILDKLTIYVDLTIDTTDITNYYHEEN